MVVSEITSGVKVTVSVAYQAAHSSPKEHVYVFSYNIHIQNHNPYTVQLLRRKWTILNALGEIEIVEGDGVVGRQPILYAGDEHVYQSGAAIETPLGNMSGIYFFENKSTKDIFEVKVPTFKLELPDMLN